MLILYIEQSKYKEYTPEVLIIIIITTFLEYNLIHGL